MTEVLRNTCKKILTRIGNVCCISALLILSTLLVRKRTSAMMKQNVKFNQDDLDYCEKQLYGLYNNVYANTSIEQMLMRFIIEVRNVTRKHIYLSELHAHFYSLPICE